MSFNGHRSIFSSDFTIVLRVWLRPTLPETIHPTPPLLPQRNGTDDEEGGGVCGNNWWAAAPFLYPQHDLPFLSVPLQDDPRFSNYQILLPRIVFENPRKGPNSFRPAYLQEPTTVDSRSLGILVSRDLGLGRYNIGFCLNSKYWRVI